MNTSGDAAEQVVRLSLEGMEVSLKVAGAGAKQITAMLYAMAKGNQKTHGKTRLATMLRQNQELKVFTVQNKDLATFQKEAKRYGVLYCALRKEKSDPQGTTDIMVRAMDAGKINRIVERFQLQQPTDAATIQTEVTPTREGQEPAEKQHPQKSKEELLLDRMLAKPQTREEENPTAARTDRDRSGRGSNGQRQSRSSESTSPERPSVRVKLAQIKEDQTEVTAPAQEAVRTVAHAIPKTKGGRE